MKNKYFTLKDFDGELIVLVELTRGYKMKCDAEDFIKFLTTFEAASLQADTHGYTVFWYKRKHYKFHNWLMDYPKHPLVVSHIDSDPTNNRKLNLEVVSQTINRLNLNDPLRKDNKSGIRGVYWRQDTQKFSVEIIKGGQRICLGCFDDFAEACSVREKEEIRLGFYR